MILNKSSIACALLACSFIIGSAQADNEAVDVFGEQYIKCIEIESGVTNAELNKDGAPQAKQDAYEHVFETGPKWSTVKQNAPNDPIVRQIEALAAAVGFNINSNTRIKNSMDLESGFYGGGKGYDVARDQGLIINGDWKSQKFNAKSCANVRPDEVFYRCTTYVMKNVRTGGTSRKPVMEMKKVRDYTFDVRLMADQNTIVYD